VTPLDIGAPLETPEAIFRGAAVRTPPALALARALAGGVWTREECG
jgi:hypothetical protein